MSRECGSQQYFDRKPLELVVQPRIGHKMKIEVLKKKKSSQEVGEVGRQKKNQEIINYKKRMLKERLMIGPLLLKSLEHYSPTE